jgi:hypothetical protein
MMKNLHADADGGEVDGVLVYACRYWADHLSYTTRDGSDTDELVTALEKFVREKLSQWTKTLRVLASFDVIATALRKTRRWLPVGCACVAL